MDGFSVSSRLTTSDWKAYLRAYTRRAQGRGWRGAAFVIGTPVFLWVLIFTLMRFLHTPVEGKWLSIGILVGYSAILLVGLVVRSWAKPLPDAAFLGEWTFDFSPLGIRIRRPNVDSITSWAAVREIASSGDHIFIWTDSISALLVPIRDLPAGLGSERAQSALHGLKSQVGAPSGAFLPFLSDDRSIVITAAAADRTSFGCSNDRDLTNFGEAFIRDALPEAPSIRAAFEKARGSIAAREHSERLTPSMPTAYFGAAMEQKLEVEGPPLHRTSASSASTW